MALAPRAEGEATAIAGARPVRVMLVGTWALVALAHMATSPERRGLVWLVGYLLLEILTSASLGYRAWTVRGKGRVAWWLLTASALLDVFSISLWVLLALGRVIPWAPSLLRPLSLATGVLVLAGVLSFPKGMQQEGGDRRRVLDGLLFAASVLFLLWVLGAHGAVYSDQGMGTRVLVAYLNAALLGGGLVFLTSNQPQRFKGPLGWLAASALVWLIVLSGWTLAGLPQVPELRWWWSLVGGIPVFQGLAACAPASAEALPITDDSRKVARMLPYFPVVGALGVMALLIPWATLNVMRGASGIFLAMVVLLLLRQFQAIQDLQAARRTLEDRVHQRTKALEQAQDTLLRTERMNTLALMGAGLAHDLNNLLGAVKGSADLAVMNLEDGIQPRAEELNRIAMAADRAALLTRRLMEFARRENEGLQPLDLCQAAKEMELTLRLLLPKSVAFSMTVGSGGSLVVMSSRLRLEQMMVNLVANAGDAMPKGGSLHIRVDRIGLETDQAMVEVEDTGVGMAPDVLSRIFDPFFTTKAPGKGTGLGLSSLKAMVQESGGRLEVESEPGRGSRFRILVPLVASDALSPR
jgi:signal transduction histidine kinase